MGAVNRQSPNQDGARVPAYLEHRQLPESMGMGSQGKESAAATAISDAGMTLTMNSLTQQQMLMAMSPKTAAENESIGRGSMGNDSFGRFGINADLQSGTRETSSTAPQFASLNRRGNHGDVITGQGAIVQGPGGPLDHGNRLVLRPAHLPQVPPEVSSPGTATPGTAQKPPTRGTPE